MGAFGDLVGSKNKSISGGSPALSVSVSPSVGDTTIKENKRRKKRESGRKTGGAASGALKSCGVSDRGAASPADIVAGAGDIITASGIDADLLPASVGDVSRLLPSWVSAWCSDNDVSDVRKVSPLVFGSLCSYIGKYIKASHVLKDQTRAAAGACVGSTCNRYNPQAVAALLDVFADFCGVCDKVPFQTSFAAFCGVSIMYVRDYVQRLTSSGVNLAQKTRDIEMDSLRRSASRDPVGRLAILNNEYWSGGGSASGGADRVAASLPSSGSFGLIECKKVD